MRYKLTDSTAFPVAEISLSKGETVQIESGSMIYHNGNVKLEGKSNSSGGGIGGLLKAAVRSAVTGESMFITHVTGLTDNAMVAIAPNAPGAIRELELAPGRQFRIRDQAFLACDGTTAYQVKKQSLGKALFGGTGGLFIMETTGTGSMLVNSYGDIIEFTLDGSKPFVVDNNHVVAWSTTLDYNIKVASGTFGFTSGEGLVNEFNGSGTILIQTRNVESLAGLIKPFLPNSSG
ncbi:MAG: TIGR00266 family protein [Oscillospiraceae bacterium]|nr:TIGR00266 family protein [Oscillospiraceae bacterium]